MPLKGERKSLKKSGRKWKEGEEKKEESILKVGEGGYVRGREEGVLRQGAEGEQNVKKGKKECEGQGTMVMIGKEVETAN